MSLAKIKGEYDAIFSLGDLCLAAIQLEKNNLRPFSGVLDWMASPNLSDVNRLLRNRFIGFMERENLRVIEQTESFIVVSDDAYQMVSNHDFEVDKNTLTNLATYPEVREKYDRRIKRFLEKLDTSNRILFVRTEAEFQDTLELDAILSSLVKHDYRILIVNHTNVNTMVEKDWPIERVCVVDLPNQDKWEGNHHYWKNMLNEVTISNKL